MRTMSYKRPGYRVDRCKCKILRSGYRPDETGSVVLLTRSNSLCRLLDLSEKSKPNFIVNILEKIYERCAAYNLRHCPIRGFVKHDDSYITNTVKDFIILTCFLVANFIVFLAIMTKTIVHISLVLIMAVQWIRRSFLTKLDLSEEIIPSSISPAQLYHDYTPPITDKFFSRYTKCL